MEHEELVRLAGEQALLRKEHTDLSAVFNRDKQALLNLYNEINAGHGKTTWLEGGIALLQRLHKTQSELSDLHRRLSELGKLPSVYSEAKWRNTTPVADDGMIGIGFDLSASTLRLKLRIEDARHLMETLHEYVGQHQSSRCHSETSSGMPSEAVSTPLRTLNV